MKPLHIDFAPPAGAGRSGRRLRWFAGGASAVLLVVASAAWWLAPAAEASYTTVASAPRLPSGDEAMAVDAAVRHLNARWIEALAAMESVFGATAGATLLNLDADVRHGTLKVSGEARDSAAVLDLPQRLRGMPVFAGATLLGQEVQEATALRPVRFTLELRLKDPA